MKKLLPLFCLILFASCSDNSSSENSTATQQNLNSSNLSLDEILDSQTDAMKSRYEFRHPKETLEFFGIEPGMTVVEALPGLGWYTKILVPFIGSEGTLVGANYSADMWSLIGYEGERLEKMAAWYKTWPAEINEKDQKNGGAKAEAFMLGNLPVSMHGRADAVLMIRALHNLVRFESQGGFLTSTVKNTFDILKPGGIVGIVQHEAPDQMADELADGTSGYLKKDFVIQLMTQAGFELVGDSNINENDKDQPTAEDIVWRLPPTLATSRGGNEELKNLMNAIGESNRMTLKFKKPV